MKSIKMPPRSGGGEDDHRAQASYSASSPNTNLLADALAYHARGIACIPTTAKKALVKWKPYQHQRPTEAEIREWFTCPNVTGIGVIAGEVSGGLAIRDFDRVDAYRAFASRHPRLAKSLSTVRTRRGYHVYAGSNLHRIVKLADGEYRGAGITIA